MSSVLQTRFGRLVIWAADKDTVKISPSDSPVKIYGVGYDVHATLCRYEEDEFQICDPEEFIMSRSIQSVDWKDKFATPAAKEAMHKELEYLVPLWALENIEEKPEDEGIPPEDPVEPEPEKNEEPDDGPDLTTIEGKREMIAKLKEQIAQLKVEINEAKKRQ